MRTKFKGALGQLRVAYAYQHLGYNVLLPFGDLQRYDLAIEKSGTFHRVQVKTVEERGGLIYVDARVIGHNRKRVNIYLPTRDDFDILAIVENRSQNVYAVPFDGSQRQFSLRTQATRNNQSKKIQFAENYRIM